MLYYEKIDNNREGWVVFIHGLGGSVLTWNKQREEFSKDYNILLIDLNGHGKSQDISFNGIRDYADVCDNIKEILDKNNISKAHFVGMSLGTFVLVVYTTRYPETVGKLVMGGGVIKLERNKILLLDFIQAIKYIVPSKVLYTVFSYVIMPKDNHKRSREIFNREALKVRKREFIAWVQSLEQIKAADMYIERLNTNSELNILYVMGREDHMFLRGTEKAVELLEKAKLSVIENCGHVCTIEKYKEFNYSALEFLLKDSDINILQ